MKDLKECPFCGGEVEWCKNNSDLHHSTDNCHYITCERCGEFSLNMPDIDFPKVYYAIADQWNTRTSIPISKLKELISKSDTFNNYAYSRADLLNLIDKAKQ